MKRMLSTEATQLIIYYALTIIMLGTLLLLLSVALDEVAARKHSEFQTLLKGACNCVRGPGQVGE